MKMGNRKTTANEIFYHLKPVVPRCLQIVLRRGIIQHQQRAVSSIWPIDPHSSKPPKNWRGWPDKKRFAFVLTHDVESAKGRKKCAELMKIEQKHVFCSSFNFVAEKYHVYPTLRDRLCENGFEVGVHGLAHDGKLFKNKKVFSRRAKKINSYLKKWGAVGFRSPAMHHNLQWQHDLDIAYDLSTFDTDPFEPQSDGVGTIFPFWVKEEEKNQGYVELPYTLPQDFTLFVLMQQKDISIWKSKVDWIVEHGGMVLVNTHPDYMNFSKNKSGVDEYPVEYYEKLLHYVKSRYYGQYWHVLPKQVAEFWKMNYNGTV